MNNSRRTTFRNCTMCALVVLSLFVTNCFAETIIEALDANKQLKTYANLAKQDKVLNAVMETKPCTVFAPTNEAYERFKHPQEILTKTPSLHLIRLAVGLDSFPSKYHSELPAAADLHLTKLEPDESNDVDTDKKTKYFVNNALVIEGPISYKANDGKSDQFLYIIDEVLYPYETETRPPSAFEMFTKKQYMPLKDYDGVNMFFDKIKEFNLDFLYQKEGGSNTFFVPTSMSSEIARSIDDATIRGHVIPNYSLFSRTAGDKVYHSAVFNDTFRVELSIEAQHVNDSLQKFNYRVQSNTLTNSTSHHNGISKVKISKPNVPVTNGVVHFIDTPLMVISHTISKILEEKMYASLSEITRLLQSDAQIKSMLESPRPTTLLAFTDAAFQKVSEKWKVMNESEKKEILKLHIISGESIPSGSITAEKNKRSSMAQSKDVFFNVYEGPGGKRVLSVEGGGVNATAIQADIGATNGIVHVIDRVLGIPFQTIREKLETDSNVRTTYDVGAFGSRNWNDRLGSSDEKFTLFAPSAKAWEYMSIVYPSEYKQLTTGMYPVNGYEILDRHLVIGKVLMASDFQSETVVETVRGQIKIRRTATNELEVEWEDVKAPVSRSDVLAMNGVIHEIDRVLMKKRDLAVSEGMARRSTGSASALIATTLPLLILIILQLV